MYYGATGMLYSLCLFCIRFGLWLLQMCSKAVLSAFKIYPNSRWWGAGLELLKAVLVASRMETRS